MSSSSSSRNDSRWTGSTPPSQTAVRRMAGQNAGILPLIVLPLLAPAVIFGAGAVAQVLDGMDGSGALGLLAAFSFGAVLLSPFAAAASVRLNLDG